MRPPVLMLVAVWAPVLLLSDLYAQGHPIASEPGTVHLSSATFASEKRVDLSTILWRFRDGDDPSWADPSLDDADWGLRDTDALPDALHPEVWQGVGWFRLHLQVDSSLHHTLLGLHMYHAGASEVYLDGRRIGGFGEIGASGAADQSYIPLGLPLSIHLDDSNRHVLAVRYANRSLSPWAIRQYRTWPFLPAGFALVVGPNTDVVHGYVFEKSALYTEALIMGLLIAILILHLLLYLFDRRDRANLFYGLAVAFLCIGHFCAHAMGYRVLLIDGSWNGALLNEIGNQTFVLFALLLLATLYALFAPHLLRLLWGGAALGSGRGTLVCGGTVYLVSCLPLSRLAALAGSRPGFPGRHLQA